MVLTILYLLLNAETFKFAAGNPQQVTRGTVNPRTTEKISCRCWSARSVLLLPLCCQNSIRTTASPRHYLAYVWMAVYSIPFYFWFLNFVDLSREEFVRAKRLNLHFLVVWPWKWKKLPNAEMLRLDVTCQWPAGLTGVGRSQIHNSSVFFNLTGSLFVHYNETHHLYQIILGNVYSPCEAYKMNVNGHFVNIISSATIILEALWTDVSRAPNLSVKIIITVKRPIMYVGDM